MLDDRYCLLALRTVAAELSGSLSFILTAGSYYALARVGKLIFAWERARELSVIQRLLWRDACSYMSRLGYNSISELSDTGFINDPDTTERVVSQGILVSILQSARPSRSRYTHLFDSLIVLAQALSAHLP